MPKMPVIGDSIKPVGQRPQPDTPYSAPVRKTEKHIKLRTGEILHGSILDLPAPEEAVVRLPIGTFRAQLQGKLKRGDSLFFKVAEIEPALVLKIYGVAVKSGNAELSVEDIIRILNLPDFPLYKEIIDFLKKFRTTLNRDEALLIFKALNSLQEASAKQRHPKELIQLLFTIHEAGIPLESDIVGILLPLFRSGDSAALTLLQLERLAIGLPPEIAANIARLIKLIKSPTTSVNERLKFFSLRADKHKSLFETLMDIVKLEPREPNEIIAKAKTAARYLLEAISALHLWNTLSSKNNSQIRLLIPILIDEKPVFLQLVLQRQNESQQLSNQTLQFFFEVFTPELGDVVAQGSSRGHFINLNLFGQTQGAVALLDENGSKLKGALAAEGLNLLSFSVSVMTDEDIYLKQEQSQAQPKNFTVVV